MIAFVAMTLVAEGFVCGHCPQDVSQRRGCARRGQGRPTVAAFRQEYGGRSIDRFECPQSAKTAEHAALFRSYLHWREGRVLYPTLRDYPDGMLRRLEVVDAEVRALQAQQQEQELRRARSRAGR